MVQKWFDLGIREGKLILTGLLGLKDYYSVPLSSRAETIVMRRALYMVEELGACMEEVCNTLQEAISLHTMVMDNELGISGGWKKHFVTKDFNKKKVQRALDHGKTLSMQLDCARQHLEERAEHPFAPFKHTMEVPAKFEACQDLLFQ